MKRLLLFLTVFLATLTTHAEGKSLFITFNDGSKAEFAMADNPAVTMTAGLMTVVAGTTTISYELWRVKQFTFGTSTGIRNVSGLRIKDGRIAVYTLDGKAVNVQVSQGEADLDRLPPGIYIININGNTLKYMKP